MMATIHACKDFSAERAAKELAQAFKGLGTNEKKVIEVLVGHDNKQRQEIKAKYQNLFGRDLHTDIKKELSGNFENACLALLTPAAAFLAIQLVRTMKGPGTDESTMVEILCGNSNKDIAQIKAAFSQLAGRNLEDAIMKETSGHLKRLLISQASCARDESDAVNKEQAEDEAKEIFEAGEKRFGTDESVFQRILCSRNYKQLNLTFEIYKHKAGHDIEDAIIRETKGPLRDGLLAIVGYSKHKCSFFAERLHTAIRGAGTKDDDLVRLLVSRAEIDLAHIAEDFLKKYGKTLTHFIRADTSKDYQALLVAIANEK